MESRPAPLPNPLTWQGVAEHCLAIPELTPYQREAARRGISYLGKVMGDKVLESPHPVRGMILNYAPWTRVALTSLAADLQAVEKAPGFDTLVTRLRSSEKWKEGLSVTEIAARLAQQHFAIEFDPPVTVRGGPKVPDLLIVNKEVDDHVFVEIASLGASKSEMEAHHAFDTLSGLFWANHDLEFSGRMLRTPSPQLLEQMLRRTQDAITRAKTTNEMQVVEIPYVLELAIAPRTDVAFLQIWKKERDVQGFSGPGTPLDVATRIKGKIRNEQKQLPRDALGAIVLDVPYGFFRWETEDFEARLREFGEVIAEFPHLLSVVLQSRFLDFSPEKIFHQVEGQTHAKVKAREPFSEELFILTNRYCKLKLAPATMTAWSRSFIP